MSMSRTLAAGIALVLFGCGGSGGGGGGSGGLTGNFKALQLTGLISAGSPNFVTFTGDAVATASTIESVTTRNDQSVVTPGVTSTLGYTLGTDRSFSIVAGTTTTGVGWVDTSLDVALAGGTLPGDAASFACLVRSWPGTATNASFTGSFHVGGMGCDGSVTALSQSATSNGAGTVTTSAAAIVNTEGVITSGSGDVVAYAVAADGTTTIGNPGDPAFSGGLTLDGNLLVVSGSTTATEDPRFIVLLKTAVGALNTTLSGTYRVVGLAYDFTTPLVRSMTGTMTADGIGGASISWTVNTGGTITNPAAFAATYTVAADGALNLTLPSTNLRGGVSQDGNRGFAAGGTGPGSEPMLLIFVRQ